MARTRMTPSRALLVATGLLTVATHAVGVVGAFVLPFDWATATHHSSTSTLDMSILDTLQDDLSVRWRIFQDSSGSGFKQTMANVIAGDYNVEETRNRLDTLIASAPVVLFVWEASPSCKQAIEALGAAGAAVKTVRLDDPWSEGNVLRAELGKRVGRSSVPAIFLDGVYVGGFDGGVSDEAPGIVSMAFAGTLRPKLQALGALKE